MRIALTALTDAGPRDVVVSGDPGITVASVARSLAAVLGDGQPFNVTPHPRAFGGAAPRGTPPPLFAAGRPLDPRASASAYLRDGMVVTFNPRAAFATMLAEPKGLTEIRVIGGAGAGAVHRIGLGDTTFGPALDADVRLEDPAARTLKITVTTDTVAVRAPDATLDAAPLGGEPAEWAEGGVLLTGSTALTVARPAAPDAHLEPMDGGGLAYNRPPRILPPGRPRSIEVPVEPQKGTRERLRLLSSLLFAVSGLVMVAVTGQWYWALMALSYPLIQVGEWLGDRRYGRKSYKKAMKEYRAKKESFSHDLERLREKDEAERREVSPDPATVLLTATGPRRRLWERRLADPDALALRFGLADLPARIELTGPEDKDKPEVPVSRSVPVVLPLPELGVIGLSGARECSRGLARWLTGQATALHSPRDLSIVVLSAEGNGDSDWDWVRWLPHSMPREGEECLSLVGTDPDTVARRVAELAMRITERRRAGDSSGSAGGFGSFSAGPSRPAEVPPYNILVVLDGARTLRRVPGMPQVLSGGPRQGVYAICIDDDERLLPEECAAVASWDWDLPSHIRIRGIGLDLDQPVLADQVSPAWCSRMARSLTPVRDVSREDADAMIPSSSRLLDVLRMPDPSASSVTAVWARGGRTTRVPVGESGDGIFTVDLRLDGPHGLIAGTTGAGKSELLQTFIASLAVANRPDEMTFVLIDYKGGSAFKDCAKLPHTVGMVTDLDGHLTERALESLGAELKRREHMLLAAEAKDVEDYCDLRDSGDPRASQAMPRLVLVIDEFAAMVTELPDFVVGLVDIGRRGRSLGVHLILATQRPAGVVTGDIRANTNLRIALRVTDADESADVIEDPSAARISKSTPGRCFVRSGASSPVMVQSSRIGGRRPGSGPAADEVTVTPLPWTSLGRPLPSVEADADESTMVTDLGVLVEAIDAAAAGVPRQPSPWLDPLPDVVTLDELPSAAGPGGPGGPEVAPIPFGMTDLPASQARTALALDLAGDGNVYVAGSARSGLSTVLRTLAGSIAASCSPADVHVYAIDCGANALLPLVSLPHCGAVVGRDEVERVERLLARLRAEVGRRQQLLAEKGFASIAEQRAVVPCDQRLPWMVLLLDRWESFFASFENYDYGRLVEGVLRLLREGAAVGLRGVFTGDRSGLTGQASTVFDKRLVLRMGNPDDYGYAGIPERQVPQHMPPGRVLEPVGPAGKLLRDSQVALLCKDDTGPAQVAALQELARVARQKHGSPPSSLRAMRVDELPVRATYEEAMALRPGFRAPSPLWAMTGVGGDELSPVGIDLLGDSPGFVVSGPPRSGRSTVLMTAVGSLLDPEVGDGLVPVVLIAPRRSPLRQLAGCRGVLGVLGSGATPADLEAAVGEAPVAGRGRFRRYVIVVDDAELVPDEELGDAIAAHFQSARDGEHGVIYAGTTDDLGSRYTGFIPDIRRARCGVLLGIQSPEDGEILGVRLPRNADQGGAVGRGIFARLGTVSPIQVALPD